MIENNIIIHLFFPEKYETMIWNNILIQRATLIFI